MKENLDVAVQLQGLSPVKDLTVACAELAQIWDRVVAHPVLRERLCLPGIRWTLVRTDARGYHQAAEGWRIVYGSLPCEDGGDEALRLARWRKGIQPATAQTLSIQWRPGGLLTSDDILLARMRTSEEGELVLDPERFAQLRIIGLDNDYVYLRRISSEEGEIARRAVRDAELAGCYFLNSSPGVVRMPLEMLYAVLLEAQARVRVAQKALEQKLAAQCSVTRT